MNSFNLFKNEFKNKFELFTDNPKNPSVHKFTTIYVKYIFNL